MPSTLLVNIWTDATELFQYQRVTIVHPECAVQCYQFKIYLRDPMGMWFIIEQLSCRHTFTAVKLIEFQIARRYREKEERGRPLESKKIIIWMHSLTRATRGVKIQIIAFINCTTIFVCFCCIFITADGILITTECRFKWKGRMRYTHLKPHAKRCQSMVLMLPCAKTFWINKISLKPLIIVDGEAWKSNHS